MKPGATSTTQKPGAYRWPGVLRLRHDPQRVRFKINGKDDVSRCRKKRSRLIHWEFVPPGQTVNAAFYEQVLKRQSCTGLDRGCCCTIGVLPSIGSHCDWCASILVSTRCYCDRSPTVLTRSGTS